MYRAFKKSVSIWARKSSKSTPHGFVVPSAKFSKTRRVGWMRTTPPSQWTRFSGGVPGLLTIWARTQGSANAVKGIAAFSSQPILLNTSNPKINRLADYTDQDKIALPAVKVSVQAMMLQMAAAKEWGEANYAKLDPITVGMSPPDSTIALLSGTSDITSVFSVPPFQYQQLEKPGIHTVLNSYEVFGGPHTFTVAWTTSQFRDKNPALYKALIAAFTEATEMLKADVRPASQYWIDNVKSKMTLDKVAAIAAGVALGRNVRGIWSKSPEGTCTVAGGAIAS